MGFDLTHVDVGGGLGVDYEGSRTTRPASMNYTTREYANDVVYLLEAPCRRQFSHPMPHIISESGRALTAHHALLLINVTDVEALTEPVIPALREDPRRYWSSSRKTSKAMTLDRVDEVFHDAVFAKERLQELFASDAITLRDMADIDQYYLATMNGIAAIAHDRASYPEIVNHGSNPGGPVFLQFLGVPVAARQLGNRPDLPDHAGAPARGGADPAGDAAGHHLRFGRSDRPVAGGRKGSLHGLHPFREGEPYILGIFLTGAYQEILGDLHNLFGDTNAVHIKVTEKGYNHRHGARRHGDRGAQLRPVQGLGPAPDLPPQGRATAVLPGRTPTRSLRTTWRGWRYTYLEDEGVPAEVLVDSVSDERSTVNGMVVLGNRQWAIGSRSHCPLPIAHCLFRFSMGTYGRSSSPVYICRGRAIFWSLSISISSHWASQPGSRPAANSTVK